MGNKKLREIGTEYAKQLENAYELGIDKDYQIKVYERALELVDKELFGIPVDVFIEKAKKQLKEEKNNA